MGEPTQETCPKVGISYIPEQSHSGGDSKDAPKGGNRRAVTGQRLHRVSSQACSLSSRKMGGMRLVINLKQLNKFIPPHHFKMEGMHTLKDLLKKDNWLTKVDAYFTIPIHKKDRLFLRFSAQDCHYQFTCLSFGLSCTTWVFTKTIKPALTLLRELGVRLVAYIDNIMAMAETKQLARDHTQGLIHLLENLASLYI